MKKGWEVRISDKALKSFKKMDRSTAAIILRKFLTTSPDSEY